MSGGGTQTGPQPLTIIAHRGASSLAPENTLAAFEKAIALGAPWIELDVQLHADRLWVIHDERLDRTTNGHGRLVDHSPQALKKLDAGAGQRIPRLEDVLKLVRRRVRINIELKSGAGTAQALARCLREAFANGWAPEDFMVSSFILPELREFKRQLPGVSLGVLLCGVPLDLAACASQLGAQALNLSLEFADPGLIADARRRGLKVYVYTVDDPDDAARLQGLGVAGIFTNYPQRFLKEK